LPPKFNADAGEYLSGQNMGKGAGAGSRGAPRFQRGGAGKVVRAGARARRPARPAGPDWTGKPHVFLSRRILRADPARPQDRAEAGRALSPVHITPHPWGGRRKNLPTSDGTTSGFTRGHTPDREPSKGPVKFSGAGPRMGLAGRRGRGPLPAIPTGNWAAGENGPFRRVSRPPAPIDPALLPNGRGARPVRGPPTGLVD